MVRQPQRARLASWSGALALATALLAPAAGQAAYVLNEVTIAGASSTAVWDINNAGTIVGYSNSGPANLATGFIRTSGGTLTSLSGPAGAVSASALGISDGGVVVGSYSSTLVDDGTGLLVAGPMDGFIYTAGSYTLFSVAGATSTFLRGISPDGRYLSGYYSTATNAGIAFVYDTSAGILRSVPESATSSTTIGQGITNAGLMVGGDLVAGPDPGFFYDFATGTRTDVMLTGATRTALRSLDDAGILAGWFIDGTGQHGFVGSLSQYEQIDVAGAESTVVEGSNNARWLVGEYFDAAGNAHGFVATPVPAPGSLALALAGLLAIGRAARRRPGPRAS